MTKATDAELVELAAIPEASWVTSMRQHFAEHGFYRQEDLNRVLGAPGDSVGVGSDGKLVYRRARASKQKEEG